MAYYGISDAINDILDEMHFLEFAFEHELINYSALARLIKPLVIKKLGAEDVSLDAIIIGIRRYAEQVPKAKNKSYAHLSKCRVDMRSGMVWVNFKRTEELFRKIIELENSIDYIAGEKMYVIQRTDEISVISMNRFLPALQALSNGDKSQILGIKENLALATIQLPSELIYEPGILSFFTNQFGRMGVNILSIFSSFSKLSFLFSEEDAPAMYERLNNAMSTAGEISEIL